MIAIFVVLSTVFIMVLGHFLLRREENFAEEQEKLRLFNAQLELSYLESLTGEDVQSLFPDLKSYEDAKERCLSELIIKRSAG